MRELKNRWRECQPLGGIGAYLATAFIIPLILAGSAFASSGSPELMTPLEAAKEALRQGNEAESQLTDPQAADDLPHSDLNRTQALDLFSSVFGTPLAGVAGVFEDLNVERFLSDYAAVIGPGDRPSSSGIVIGSETYNGPALLESTVPLRVEGQSGDEEIVDLGLEQSEGELQPTSPLVAVGIPSYLGEGIELPESGVQIELADAPVNRSPSIVDGTVAVYPEVAEDTSFAVAPSPTGLETFTLLQSPSAPTSTTYQLSMPAGLSLSATSDGGAEIVDGDQALLRIFPPAALDAEGNEVPVSLEVAGSSFTVQAEPLEGTNFPILVDPVIETYNWYGTKSSAGLGDWVGSSTDQGLLPNTKSALGLPGTDLRAVNGFKIAYNAKANWKYSVPRYASDIATFGTPPTSFISSMVLTNLFFVTGSDKALYPMMAAGIWNPAVGNWTSAWGHGGNTGNIENLATTYTFNNTNQDAKQAISNELWAGEAHTMTSDRETYVGSATIELADKVAPGIGSFSPPTKWVNATGPGIPFTLTDSGLGVSRIDVGVSGGKTWTTNHGCIGTVSSPCPRTWKDTGAGSLKLYNPSELAQGIHKMKAVARDPVGNQSAPYEFSLKVDHTAPAMSLSGTMLNPYPQRPRFTLKAVMTDGSEAAPQSGVVSTSITVDGEAVDATSAGCATQNCSVTREWILDPLEYAPGKHQVVVKATDGVGLTTEKTLSLTTEPDTTPPVIETLYGGLADGPSGWLEQKAAYLYVRGEDNYGSGVTAVELKIDGSLVSWVKAPCPDGSCQPLLSAEVDVSKYKGGTHNVEVLVKDGAGNKVTEAWDIHVNPKGEVSSAEAIDTLEAIEETTDEQPVAPAEALLDPAEIEEGNDPALEVGEGKLTSSGTAATTVMGATPKDGLTIEGAEGEIEVTPVGGTDEASNEVAASAAAVSGGEAVDTVTRPIYDGAMTFKSIREESAPEAYSWEVSLLEGQTLKEVDSEHLAIFNEDESQALAITTEGAHDATGKAVPASLSVSEGNILTLTVKHRKGGFVYPVVGGPAFQSSYTLPVIWEPPPPPPVEEMTQAEIEASVQSQEIYTNISAPQFAGCPDTGEACASSAAPYRTYATYACSVLPLLGCSVWEERIRGFFYYNYLQAWMSKRQPKCTHQAGPTFEVSEDYCSWVGPDHQPYGNGYHITSQVRFNVSSLKAQTPSQKHITVRMYGSGNAYSTKSPNICNPSKPSCA